MNKPTFASARLRAAALALCLAQPSLPCRRCVAATEAPIADEPAWRRHQRQRSGGDGTRYGRDQPPLPRDFVQQPPLIPTPSRGYTVTEELQQVPDCHAWSRASETGATKISVTHFKDPRRQELSSVSPRRYFCNQCHAPERCQALGRQHLQARHRHALTHRQGSSDKWIPTKGPDRSHPHRSVGVSPRCCSSPASCSGAVSTPPWNGPTGRSSASRATR